MAAALRPDMCSRLAQLAAQLVFMWNDVCRINDAVKTAKELENAAAKELRTVAPRR